MEITPITCLIKREHLISCIAVNIIWAAVVIKRLKNLRKYCEIFKVRFDEILRNIKAQGRKFVSYRIHACIEVFS